MRGNNNKFETRVVNKNRTQFVATFLITLYGQAEVHSLHFFGPQEKNPCLGNHLRTLRNLGNKYCLLFWKITYLYFSEKVQQKPTANIHMIPWKNIRSQIDVTDKVELRFLSNMHTLFDIIIRFITSIGQVRWPIKSSKTS